MSGFRPAAAGGAHADFSVGQAQRLILLSTELCELLENRGAHGSDPAVDVLLPDAYRDNAEDAAEFRRFTEDDLAARKIGNARAVAQSLSGAPRWRRISVDIDAEAVQAWLRSLTDIRLTLGARLGVEPDGSIGAGADLMTRVVYEWLGGLQDSLVAAIDI
jgi:hypothetical protein